MDAIILARSGSQGIKNKNIIEFCGKPLIEWTLSQCQRAELIENIWVSSDSNAILDISSKLGCKTIKRPEMFSKDISSSEDAWLHAIDHISSKGLKIDEVISPQITSPLRKIGDLDLGIKKYKDSNSDSLFSSSKVNDMMIWRKNEQNKLTSLTYDFNNRLRRQDMDAQYVENGSFYIFQTEVLRSKGNRFGNKIEHFEMDYWQMFEIDDMTDLRICSLLMKEFILKEKNFVHE